MKSELSLKKKRVHHIGRLAMTIAIAACGVILFMLLALPLPFLFGSLFACIVTGLVGVPLRDFGTVSTAARTVLGVAIGASITPGLITQLPELIGSILYIPLFLFVAGVVGVPWFYYLWRLNFATAYYGSMPGGLQDMVIFGIESGGDARALSLLHLTRVLVIVTIAPLVLSWVYGLSLDRPLGQPTIDTPLNELILMLLAALIGWKGGKKIGLFGAAILGPMIVTVILSLTGLVHYRPPSEAIELAQFFLAIGIGVHFVGITLRELRNFVLAGISYALLLCLITIAFVFWIIPTGSFSEVDALLAFAPGGQAEMTVLGIASGASLGFVIIHHIVRLILVISCAPIIAGLVKKQQARQ